MLTGGSAPSGTGSHWSTRRASRDGPMSRIRPSTTRRSFTIGAEAEGGPRLEDVDPEILRTFEKLAIPLEEQIPVNITNLD